MGVEHNSHVVPGKKFQVGVMAFSFSYIAYLVNELKGAGKIFKRELAFDLFEIGGSLPARHDS